MVRPNTAMHERSTTAVDTVPDRGFSLVRWGASFGGAITAVAVGTMGMALWWAIAYGSQVTFVSSNMPWFFLGTVLGSLLIGGLVAGRVAGVRIFGSRTFNGLTVWGLTVIGALIPLGIRGLELANQGGTTAARRTAFQISSGNTWALFSAIAGGLLCAVVGAWLGGMGRAGTAVTAYEVREELRPPAAPSARAG